MASKNGAIATHIRRNRIGGIASRKHAYVAKRAMQVAVYTAPANAERAMLLARVTLAAVSQVIGVR
ncbi:hypothetical protein Poly51_02160 [Rubripirellula tenax]|uniref:Uncharacterized protein n=1 Tax=Rubripirellula tenax TaxID=2528015 RepID=A0A5C6FHC7_9BACT|nr:hypothetical protein Poly51_02160 [Rubripirellula tenax]